MGGKCPLELLQQTCASIGRESPTGADGSHQGGKKRKLENVKAEKGNNEGPGAKQSKNVKEDINQNKYIVKTEHDSAGDTASASITVAKLAKMSPERKVPSPRKSPLSSAQHQQSSQSTSQKMRPKVSSASQLVKKTSPVTTPQMPVNMSSLMLNPSSLLHNAEIDRNLRAYASFYSASSALQHPLASSYPSSFVPGLLPSAFPYMPYFSGYPQANASALSGLFPSLQQSTTSEAMAAQMAQLAAMSQQQQAEQAAAAYAFSAESALLQQATKSAAAATTATSNEERICNWAACGKKFATADKLAEHVKEHINTSSAGSTTSAPADSTTGSTPNTATTAGGTSQNGEQPPKSATVAAAAAAAASLTAPRFNPYGALSSYPRDLLNSRFVYS